MKINTNWGMRGVRARYDAALPPNISIVGHPGRPVIPGMDFFYRKFKFEFAGGHRGGGGGSESSNLDWWSQKTPPHEYATIVRCWKEADTQTDL